MLATTRSYSSGKFMLEIEGKAVGFLLTVEGGEPFAAVINEPGDDSGVARKSVGPMEFSPICMTFGTGMGKPLYQWMAEVLNRKGSAKKGAILFVDYNFEEQSRLEFDNAVITEVAFPELDARSKGTLSFTLTLQPEATRISKASNGSSVLGFGTKNRKAAGITNFRIKISGLETACAKVNWIDSIIVKHPVNPRTRIEEHLTTEVLKIPNVAFTLAESHAQDFYDWFEDFVLKGNNAPEKERTGTLEFLDASLKTVLFTLTFANLGVFRIQKERSVTDANVIARVRVEIYCEEMAFTSAEESAGSAVPPSASEAPSIASATSSVNARLAETLLGIMSGRIHEEDALRATLRIAGLPQITNSNETAESELIARRLLATVRPVVFSPSARDDGASIGERWATEKATLEELDQVSALESGEWNAMRLGSEHSLIVQLREVGVIPAGGDGPIDLERDNFVEGIVAGASRVLRSAAPHLSRQK